jgi:hypothetical protein
MDDVSIDTVLQMSDDELAEVLEELTGIELEDQQIAGMRSLIQAAGSLDAALDLLDDMGDHDSMSEAA